jgi:type I site-specific restriction endonuclease
MAKKKKKPGPRPTAPAPSVEELSDVQAHALNYEAVSAFWLMLRDKGGEIYDACPEEKRELLQAIRSSARDAFFKAKNERLEDNNAVVAQIRKELTDITKRLKEDLTDLKKIEAILKKLTEAVKLAGSIVSLAATV